MSQAGTNGSGGGGGGGDLKTLSDDVSTIVTPIANNIQLVGHVVEQGATKFSTVVSGTHLININPMSTARWIVDPLGFNGTHTTVSGALASASSGDTIFLLPGVYTEDYTGNPGVSITAYTSDDDEPNVTIVGKCTYTQAGTFSISNIQLQTNGDFILAVTGSATSAVYLDSCRLMCTNNTGISQTSSGGGEIKLINCISDISTTGIALFAKTGTGNLQIRQGRFTNSGNTSTPSTISSGVLTIAYCEFLTAVTTSGIAGAIIEYVTMDGSSTNTTAFTANGSLSHDLKFCYFSGGSSPAISVGTGTIVSLDQCTIVSSNTNAITGLGTIRYSVIDFSGPSTTVNVSTQTPRSAFLVPDNYSTDGIAYFDGFKLVTTAAGTSGQVLTSQGAGSPPIYAPAAGGITTINGDSGSITGSTVTVYANNTANTSGASVKFVNSGTVSTLNVSDSGSNTFVGTNCGTTTVSGTENCGYGTTCLQSITSGTFNTAYGSRSQHLMQNGLNNTSTGIGSLGSNVSGSSNCAYGYISLFTNTSDFNSCFGASTMATAGAGTENCCFGFSAGTGLTSGSTNCLYGLEAGQSITSGGGNIIIGALAGTQYTSSESSNILLGHVGVTAETGIIRIGTSQNKAFMAGISGVTVASSSAVLIDANGQMGTVLSSKRFKENIKDLKSDNILKLQPVTFDYIETKETNAGLIAEEVYEQIPELVILDSENKPYTVRYEQLCVYLLAEVKKLSEKVLALENTVYE